ncbi:hypothetical protein [Flexistipes sp.]|uniref:hypothetical protein n=1 Tax=Flexistipes sp. TaxID=3088135 RepID=UPI002E1B7718|nr:hypothetical protein [Flexistipes sp.]
MDNDNLKEVLDVEHEVTEKINEEQKKFDSELKQFKNELEEKIASLQENLKQDLEIFREECKKDFEYKFKEDLQNLKERNERIKNLEFSFLQTIIEPYIKEILD